MLLWPRVTPRSLKHRPDETKPDLSGIKVVLHNRLRAILAAKGIPKQHIAKRIRVSNRHFYRLIDGLTPRLDIAIATAAVLDVPVEHIWPAILKPTRHL